MQTDATHKIRLKWNDVDGAVKYIVRVNVSCLDSRVRREPKVLVVTNHGVDLELDYDTPYEIQVCGVNKHGRNGAVTTLHYEKASRPMQGPRVCVEEVEEHRCSCNCNCK